MAATTTPDGLIYPTLADQGDDIPVVMAALANSTQTAITNLKNSHNTRLVALESDTTATPTLGTFWQMHGTKPLRVHKKGNVVSLSGAVTNVPAGNYDGREYVLGPAGSIPAGYRPTYQARHSIVAHDGVGHIIVMADGSVNIRLGFTGNRSFATGQMWVFFDGANWRV